MFRIALLILLPTLLGCMPKQSAASLKNTSSSTVTPTVPAAASAEDQKQIDLIVQKAILALGGERIVRKMQNNYTQAEGTTVVGNEEQQCVWKTWQSLPNRLRFATVYNNINTLTSGVNGDKGWVRFNQTPHKELLPEEVNSLKEMMYLSHVMSLIPLLDRKVTIRLLPEKNIDGEPSQGLAITSGTKPEIQLYFSRDTSLLKYAATDFIEANTMLKLRKEIYLGDYKDVGGGKLYHRLVVYFNGNKNTEQRITRWELFDSMKDSDFAP